MVCNGCHWKVLPGHASELSPTLFTDAEGITDMDFGTGEARKHELADTVDIHTYACQYSESMIELTYSFSTQIIL